MIKVNRERGLHVFASLRSCSEICFLWRRSSVFRSPWPATEDPSRAADYDALRNLAFHSMKTRSSSNNLTKVKPLLAAGFTGVMISGEESEEL